MYGVHLWFLCTRRDPVAGKSVYLVDDVYTTGATLDACAAALKKAGAVKVVALTVCRVTAADHKNGHIDMQADI